MKGCSVFKITADGELEQLNKVPIKSKGWVTYELCDELTGVNCTFENANRHGKQNPVATKIYRKYYNDMLKLGEVWGDVYFHYDDAGIKFDQAQLKIIKSFLI